MFVCPLGFDMATKKEEGIDPLVVRHMFDYRTSDGVLIWKNVQTGRSWKRHMVTGNEAMTTVERKGYLSGVIQGVRIKTHRAVWAWHHGSWPDKQIDHINGVTSDNRIENLRQSENTENCRNQSRPKNNESGWIGVSLNKRTGRWVAKYKKDYVDFHVGCFNCPTAAGIAVMKARLLAGFSDLHGR